MNRHEGRWRVFVLRELLSVNLLALQEVYMSSNGISPLQWHPFTTIPGEQAFSMVSIIKQYGKWTGQLMDR